MLLTAFEKRLVLMLLKKIKTGTEMVGVRFVLDIACKAAESNFCKKTTAPQKRLRNRLFEVLTCGRGRRT